MAVSSEEKSDMLVFMILQWNLYNSFVSVWLKIIGSKFLIVNSLLSNYVWELR